MPQASTTPFPVLKASVAGSLAMGQTELGGAAALSAVMANAAVAQAGCQQVELSVVGVLTALIAANAAKPPSFP